MLKKILCLSLAGVMALSLTACGGNSTSTSSSKKQTKSSLKGDFVFFEKNDNSGTYFTNNDDIPETLLSDKGVDDICVDEKRKNIIYVSDSNLYIKSLKKLDELPIEVSNYMLYWREGDISNHIWNNQIIFYNEGNSLFIYDLDSQKKERLSENIGKINLCGNNLIYTEYIDTNDNGCKFVVYNLKNNKKNERDIRELNILDYSFAGEIMYAYCYEEDDTISKLYKISIDNMPVVIDEMNTEKLPNVKNKYLFLHHKIVDTFSDGEMYFMKPTKYKDTGNITSPESTDYIYFYYDGIKLHEFAIGERIFNLDYEKFGESAIAIAEYSDNNSKRGFIIKDKIYQNKNLNGISDDGKQIIYEDKEKNNINVLLNTSTFETIELDKRIYPYYSPIKFNAENLLFVADNKDLILNNKIIDYNVNRTVYWWGDREGVRCNDDCSVIVYISNEDTLNIYRNGDIKTIGSSIKIMQLSNNNNAYFWRDNNIYLYKNDDVNLIAESASIKEYSLIK